MIFIAAVGLATLGLQIPVVIEQRGVVSDRQAVSDMQDIKTGVTNYMLDKGRMPGDLTDITITGSAKDRLSNYEYKRGSGSAYDLCATFSTDTTKKGESSSASDSSSDYYATIDTFSSHKKGYQCFTEQAGYDYNTYNYDAPDSGNTLPIGDANDKANDSQIMTDLTILRSHLEAYYAGSGVYPTLAQLQDATWRSTNMVGLDSEAIVGPNSETIGYGYTYTPAPSGCQTDCSSFTLSAEYSDGTIYSVKSY